MQKVVCPLSGSMIPPLRPLPCLGIMAAFKIREKWINYRTAAENMRSEYWLYKTGSGPYSHGDRQRIFVERIELLLSEETRAWRAVHKKK